MQHLDTERIAALDHEAATVDELAHLSVCAVCRAERSAFEALARLAAQVGGHDAYAAASSDAPRLTEWDVLSAELRREGMLTSASDHRVPETPLVVRALDGTGARFERTGTTQLSALTPSQGRRSAGMPVWLRSAAALALLATGVSVGRISAGAALLPSLRGAAGEVGTNVGASVGAQTLRPASLGGADTFASVEQATAVLGNAQTEYERASLWLAANDTTVRSSDVYRARLAALDQMMAASRVALREAPQDPVLNHYYLAASTARDAALHQLSGVLPVDKTIEGY